MDTIFQCRRFTIFSLSSLEKKACVRKVCLQQRKKKVEGSGGNMRKSTNIWLIFVLFVYRKLQLFEII